MRSPSARCTPNTVQNRSVLSWSKDPAGGRIPIFSDWSAPTVCTVQPSSAVDVAPHLRDENVTYHTVIYHSAPMLSKRDQVLWQSRILTVTGILDSSGRGSSFRVLCEERV